jgi:hypothetical protein
VGPVVGVGFVALQRKRKKQIPRYARNDNLQELARAWAELMVGRWWVAVGRCWVAGVVGERRPEGRRYDGVGSGRCGCC